MTNPSTPSPAKKLEKQDSGYDMTTAESPAAAVQKISDAKFLNFPCWVFGKNGWQRWSGATVNWLLGHGFTHWSHDSYRKPTIDPSKQKAAEKLSDVVNQPLEGTSRTEGETPNTDFFFAHLDYPDRAYRPIHKEFAANLEKAYNKLKTQLTASLSTEQRLREELKEAKVRDGSWLDNDGSCRVCDGEIPHGHTSNCDLFKMEQENERLKRETRTPFESAVLYATLQNQVREWCLERESLLALDVAQIDGGNIVAMPQVAAEKTRLYQAISLIKQIREAACPVSDLKLNSNLDPLKRIRELETAVDETAEASEYCADKLGESELRRIHETNRLLAKLSRAEAELTALREELKEAKEDTRRLDRLIESGAPTLLENNAGIFCIDESEWPQSEEPVTNFKHWRTAREAIDHIGERTEAGMAFKEQPLTRCETSVVSDQARGNATKAEGGDDVRQSSDPSASGTIKPT